MSNKISSKCLQEKINSKFQLRENLWQNLKIQKTKIFYFQLWRRKVLHNLLVILTSVIEFIYAGPFIVMILIGYAKRTEHLLVLCHIKLIKHG